MIYIYIYIMLETSNILSPNDINRYVIKRTIENENIIKMFADVAQCYTRLCYKSHKKYYKIQAGLTIPVIFLSTIIGTASFTNLSTQYYFYVSMIIGTINILIGICTTILRYFEISEYTEMYKMSYIGWEIFSRNILIEYSNITNNEDFNNFFNKKKNEYEILIKNTPILPKSIINKSNNYIRDINILNRPPEVLKQIISTDTYLAHFNKKEQFIININEQYPDNDTGCCSDCKCKVNNCLLSMCYPINNIKENVIELSKKEESKKEESSKDKLQKEESKKEESKKEESSKDKLQKEEQKKEESKESKEKIQNINILDKKLSKNKN
jgi:hypothetical protein